MWSYKTVWAWEAAVGGDNCDMWSKNVTKPKRVCKMSLIYLDKSRPQRSNMASLRWRHNEPNVVSNHQHLGCLLNRLFRRTSKTTSTFRVTGLCEGKPPVTGGFPTQRASNAKKVSMWWRHHVWGIYRKYIAHIPYIYNRFCYALVRWADIISS